MMYVKTSMQLNITGSNESLVTFATLQWASKACCEYNQIVIMCYTNNSLVVILL